MAEMKNWTVTISCVRDGEVITQTIPIEANNKPAAEAKGRLKIRLSHPFCLGYRKHTAKAVEISPSAS